MQLQQQIVILLVPKTLILSKIVVLLLRVIGHFVANMTILWFNTKFVIQFWVLRFHFFSHLFFFSVSWLAILVISFIE